MNDPLARRYRDGLLAGRLLLQQCEACHRHWHYPRPLCPHCRADAFHWVPSRGPGTVYSFTIVHHPPGPAWADRVPYAVAMVALPEGPRVFARIIGEDALQLAIDDRVVACFDVMASSQHDPDSAATMALCFRRDEVAQR